MNRPKLYDDPYKIIEHKEFVTVGCGGCQHHQPNADRSEYECERHQSGYPDHTDKTCRQYKKRRGD